MKNNLKLKMAVAGLLVCVAGAASADPKVRSGSVEYARVVGVTPIVRQVRVETPARECWHETEYRTVRRDDYYRGGSVASPIPTIAGGLIGGVIGSQFGSGSGRNAMTAVGAIVGASIATEAARDDGYGNVSSSYERQPVTVERCETRVSYREEERIEGYRVTYVYAGRQYMTTMASPPGNRIPVRVTVVPNGRR